MNEKEKLDALLARHNALRDAVAATRRLEKKMESEFDDETEWKTVHCQLHQARAEVDRLLGGDES